MKPGKEADGPDMRIQNMVDVRKYLSRYGYYIYTGDPLGDLEMIKEEVQELFQAKILATEDYVQLMKVIAEEEKKWRQEEQSGV